MNIFKKKIVFSSFVQADKVIPVLQSDKKRFFQNNAIDSMLSDEGSENYKNWLTKYDIS